MALTLFDLTLLLGKLYDCQKVNPNVGEPIPTLIKRVVAEISSLGIKSYEIAQDISIEENGRLKTLYQMMVTAVQDLAQTNPQVTLLHTLRDDIGQFFISKESAFRQALQTDYRTAVAEITRVLTELDAKVAGEHDLEHSTNEKGHRPGVAMKIDLHVLDHLIDIADHRTALAMDVEASLAFAKDLAAFVALIERNVHYNLIPLMDAILNIYEDRNLFNLTITRTDLHRYLAILLAVPLQCLDYHRYLDKWSHNFAQLDKNQPAEDSSLPVFTAILSVLQKRLDRLSRIEAEVKIVDAITAVMECHKTVTDTGVWMWSALGPTAADQKSDLNFLSDLRDHLLLTLMSMRWHEDKKLFEYRPKLASSRIFWNSIQPSLLAIQAATGSPANATSAECSTAAVAAGLGDSIIGIDRSKPLTLASLRTHHTVAGTAENSDENIEDATLLAGLSDIHAPSVVHDAVKKLVERNIQERAAKATELQADQERAYIKSRKNLNQLYRGIRTHFQRMFIGYNAVASGLLKQSNKGAGRVFAAFANTLGGFGSIIFNALSLYTQRRQFVDASKISTLGEIGEVNTAIEAFARKLVLQYQFQLRMMTGGSKRGSSIARAMRATAEVSSTSKKDDDDDTWQIVGKTNAARLTKTKKSKTAYAKTSSSSTASSSSTLYAPASVSSSALLFSSSSAESNASPRLTSSSSSSISSSVSSSTKNFFAELFDKAKLSVYDNSPIDNMAEYIVAKILMCLLLEEGDLPSEGEEITDYCLRCIMDTSAMGLELDTELFNLLGFYTFSNIYGEFWHVEAMFKEPGIIVPEEGIHALQLWDAPARTTPNPYLYRFGTAEEAAQKGWLIVNKTPSPTTTPPLSEMPSPAASRYGYSSKQE